MSKLDSSHRNFSPNHKAMVLGNNYYIGLSALRCLGREGVPTVAVDYQGADPYGASSKYCQETLVTPHYQREEKEFIDFLIDYAKEQGEKPVLIPCHDAYVEVIDKNIEKLKPYFLTTSDERRLLTEVMDKNRLPALAQKHGVKTPETLQVNDPDLIEKTEQILGYPCLVKPADSPAFVDVFREKVLIVNNKEELKAAIQKASDKNLEVFVQRIIPGFDDHMFTFDAYLNQDSKLTHWTTFQKLRQFPINFGASVYTHHYIEEELYHIGRPFLEAIGYKGFGEIEFKKDAETGDFYLIEINARLTNFNELLTRIGLNMAYIMYCDLTAQPINPLAITKQQNEVFWYAHEDFRAIIGYVKSKQLSIFTIIRSLMRKKTYAIWDIKDPKPLFAFIKQKLAKRLRA